MAGVALVDLRFAWQAWHLWHWAGSGGALGLGALCVAGVALGDSFHVAGLGPPKMSLVFWLKPIGWKLRWLPLLAIANNLG